MLRKIISWIPNTITTLNLLSGCVGIIMAFRLGQTVWGLPALTWFYICIGAAALFDFCDGLSARLLRAYSNIGKELDSLSDLVSFGVAPGLLVFNIMSQQSHPEAICFIALLIPAFGALRLAKFNVDDTQSTTFKGLPIPANAIFWIGLSDWIVRYHYPGWIAMTVIILLISSAMLWKTRMFSLKFKTLAWRANIKRYGILIAAGAFVALYGISGLAWTILLYILISLFSHRNDD